MGKVAAIQSNFNAGEITPRLGGQIRQDVYSRGLDTLQNAIVLTQGGVMRRSGFEYIYGTKTNSKESILVQFEYSTEQAYILELGDLYIRFYKDGAIILNGAVPVEVVTTYTEAELSDLRFCQSADTLYIVHPDHRPATLVRTSDTVWTLADMTFTGGPTRTANATEIGLEPSAVSGAITLRTGNVIANGDFAVADIDGWTDNQNGTGNVTYNSHAMRLVGYGAGNEAIASYAFICEPGTTYQLAFGHTLTSGPGTLNIYVSSNADWTVAGDRLLTAAVTATGSYTGVFASGASDTMLWVHLETDHNRYDVDDISVRPSYFTAAMAGAIFKLNQGNTYEEIVRTFTTGASPTATLTLQTGEFIVMISGDASPCGVMTINLDASYDGGTSWNTIEQYTGPVRKRIVDTTDGAKYRLSLDSWSSGTSIGHLFQDVTVDSGVVLASTYVDAYSMTGTVQDAFPNTRPTIDWSDGAWSAVHGYPKLVAFYENRLMFACTDSDPQTVWGSQTDDYTNFEVTADAADNEAVSYALLSREMNAIRWLAPAGRLRIGTAGAEWWLSGSTDSEPLSPSSVRARADSYHGSADVQPVMVSEAILFLQRHGRKVLELAYSVESDAYVPGDLTILAEHLTRTYAITDMAFQKYPHNILWCVRSDGTLIGLTYQRHHEVIAWHKHVTDGTFESIAVIPGTAQDELWAVVNRTVEGGTVRYVERLAADFNDDTDCEDAFFVDSGVTHDGWNSITDDYLKVTGASYDDGDSVTLQATGHTPFSDPASVGVYYRLRSGTDVVDCVVTAVTDTDTATAALVGDAPASLQDTNTADWATMIETMDGLDHLEGESVAVVEDGAVAADATVASGEITLGAPSAKVHAGLGYTTDIKTLRIEGGRSDGTAQGRQKRIMGLSFRWYQTRGGKAGPDASHLETLPFDQLDGDDYSGIPLPVYSTDMLMDYPGDIEVAGQVLIRQDQPLPMCLLELTTFFETYER